MNNGDNLLGVLQTIRRWRKAFRNVCLAALVLSIVLSLMMDDYYQATTIFYPASTQLANPELMFGNTGQVMDYYGGDRELDRMAEIANSAELVTYMVAKFNLYAHYGQDSTKAKGRDKVRQIFRGLYSAIKNKNDAIEINVEDVDPQRAADMANAAREKINDIAKRLTKDAQARLLVAFEGNIKAKNTELVMLADSLRRLQNRYGIFETETMAEWMSDQFAQTEASVTEYRAKLEVLENNPLIPLDTVEYIKANLRAAERQRQRLMSPSDAKLSLLRFTEGQPQVYVLKDLHFQARKQLTYDTERYLQIKAAYQTDIPAVHVIEIADRPDLKSRPKRSLIVLGSVLAAFLFTLLGALVADAYQGLPVQGTRN